MGPNMLRAKAFENMLNNAKVYLPSGKESSHTQNGIWEHLQPGIFQCSFPLPHGVMARGAVRIGGSVIPRCV